jgi:hypothetical protein
MVLRPRGVRQRLARIAASSVAFHVVDRVGTPDWDFAAQ